MKGCSSFLVIGYTIYIHSESFAKSLFCLHCEGYDQVLCCLFLSLSLCLCFWMNDCNIRLSPVPWWMLWCDVHPTHGKWWTRCLEMGPMYYNWLRAHFLGVGGKLNPNWLERRYNPFSFGPSMIDSSSMAVPPPPHPLSTEREIVVQAKWWDGSGEECQWVCNQFNGPSSIIICVTHLCTFSADNSDAGTANDINWMQSACPQ